MYIHQLSISTIIDSLVLVVSYSVNCYIYCYDVNGRHLLKGIVSA